jgi:hypothetical protein
MILPFPSVEAASSHIFAIPFFASFPPLDPAFPIDRSRSKEDCGSSLEVSSRKRSACKIVGNGEKSPFPGYEEARIHFVGDSGSSDRRSHCVLLHFLAAVRHDDIGKLSKVAAWGHDSTDERHADNDYLFC